MMAGGIGMAGRKKRGRIGARTRVWDRQGPWDAHAIVVDARATGLPAGPAAHTPRASWRPVTI